jgi:hypothetical protein
VWEVRYKHVSTRDIELFSIDMARRFDKSERPPGPRMKFVASRKPSDDDDDDPPGDGNRKKLKEDTSHKGPDDPESTEDDEEEQEDYVRPFMFDNDEDPRADDPAALAFVNAEPPSPAAVPPAPLPMHPAAVRRPIVPYQAQPNPYPNDRRPVYVNGAEDDRDIRVRNHVLFGHPWVDKDDRDGA